MEDRPDGGLLGRGVAERGWCGEAVCSDSVIKIKGLEQKRACDVHCGAQSGCTQASGGYPQTI